VKFKIDENLPSDTAGLLRSAGIDAVTVGQQGLNGAPDPAVANACLLEERVLITLDVGFADIRTYPPGSHPGIVVMRPSSQDKATVMGIVTRLLGLVQAEPLEGKLWVVDDDRMRIRG
jgi:predicted nuclease of predicted toxin-antitoxin system